MIKNMRQLIVCRYFILFLIVFPILGITNCSANPGENDNRQGAVNGEPKWKKKAEHMVKDQISRRGVKSVKVLKAMKEIPRHLFVPSNLVEMAYNDHPLPIGHGQTISQPYIVGVMTELLQAKEGDKVLEIGAGSGYQAAVLSKIGVMVYTIEIVRPLAVTGEERLKKLGYKNVHVKWGDGYKGWPEQAPFDGIIVTAAPDEVPQALVEQLKVGGRMVIPVGASNQELLVITKTDKGIKKESIFPVRFVPMVHP